MKSVGKVMFPDKDFFPPKPYFSQPKNFFPIFFLKIFFLQTKKKFLVVKTRVLREKEISYREKQPLWGNMMYYSPL